MQRTFLIYFLSKQYDSESANLGCPLRIAENEIFKEGNLVLVLVFVYLSRMKINP